MGYNTQYELTIQCDEEDDHTKILEWCDEISDEEGSVSDEHYELYSILTDEDGYHGKWYNNKEDMLAFSKQFPRIVFIMDGHGEESGDTWRRFYKGGKTYAVHPELPDFDESLLK